MTPAARVSAAIAVLDAWRDGHAIEQALTRWARGARYAGSKDRAAVRDHVFDVLRCKGSCAALGGGDSGRALMIGLLRLHGQDPEDVFTGEGHAPPCLTMGEQEPPEATVDPALDVPDWTLPMLQQRAGEATAALLKEFQARAPLYLRVNTRAVSLDATISSLCEDGLAAIAIGEGVAALRVTDGARRLRQTRAYASGWVEPQDLSVQRAVAAVQWPETGRILDYCAGGGGKSLAIAARSEAALFAHDAEPRRMADLPTRAARAVISIALCDRVGLSRHAPYDAVLCDVPCSGSGTWRRDPEAKWRLTRAQLEKLQETQIRILKAAVPLVRPGGQLVYMTCSLFHVENEAQVARFLEGHDGWRLETQGVQTSLTASDGFFHAVFRAPDGN